MPEMILPGTYIEVRAEKLIAAGPISISNVGVVGTARRGPLNQVLTPANIGEARDMFGLYDDWENPETQNARLTLVRALELAFANGAQRVFAVRVAAGDPAHAAYTLPAPADPDTVKFTANGPGSGYNAQLPGSTKTQVEILAETVAAGLNVSITVGRLRESWRDVPAAPTAFAQVLNGKHPTYPYSSKSSTGGGSGLFTVDAAMSTGPVAAGTATQTVTGLNGAATSPADYNSGLDALINENVHIVVLAGQTSATGLITHCQNASGDLMKHERIGVIGSDPSNTRAELVAPPEDEGRLIFVGPGIKVTDGVSGREVTLPGSYSAAAVAGRIASLDPHVSPTNKSLNANGLEAVFNGTDLEQLVLGRVLALELRSGGIRIVKGITTSTNTAWSQITTRRIVDYARFGVRSACDPYIGKLNNERVRQSMKGTINGFLADMVDREMLISYEVDVTATREQQIRGIAQVTLVLRPTFSIDYIRVIMNLE